MRNDSSYQDDDGTQRYYPQGGPYEHELYPEVDERQQSYASETPRRQYDQARPSQTRTSRTYRTQRQTTADLKQVDNSQVAGRVAYDEDGNLVVVKKEEKSSPVQMAAIIGSALSAVTSAFFSSHIGIGGSVLTVAIGAAVSAAATQLYTHLIKKSTDKIKSVASHGGSGSQQLEGVMDSSQLDGGYGYGAGSAYDTAYDSDGYATADGGRLAPQAMIDAEQRERQVRRRGIIITAIAALIAVVVAAGVVTLATNGNGIGTKTPSIVSTITTTDSNANENANANLEANANESSETNAEAPAVTTNANENTTATVTEEPTSTTNTSSAANTNASGATSTTNNRGTTSTTTNTTGGNTNASGASTSSNSAASNASGTTNASSNADSGTTTSGSDRSDTTGSTTSTTGASDSGVDSQSIDTQSAGNQGAAQDVATQSADANDGAGE